MKKFKKALLVIALFTIFVAGVSAAATSKFSFSKIGDYTSTPTLTFATSFTPKVTVDYNTPSINAQLSAVIVHKRILGLITPVARMEQYAGGKTSFTYSFSESQPKGDYYANLIYNGGTVGNISGSFTFDK